VRIALDHEPLRLGPDGVAARLSPGDEELLLGREAVDGLRRVHLARLVESAPGDARTGEIADRLAP
jgi:hypothetical protein